MSNAFKVFGGLKKRVELNKDLSVKTNVRIVLYLGSFNPPVGCKTWTVYKLDVQILHVYIKHLLCKILKKYGGSISQT